MMRRILHMLALTIASAQQLAAQTSLYSEDAAKIQAFEQTAGAALLDAFATGAPADIKALADAFSGPPLVAFDQTLVGEWECRTIRLGGTPALIVYRPFTCHFDIERDGFMFEKRTGSERTKGRITFIEGRAIYAGVAFAPDQTPPSYAELPSAPAFRSHIAIFERISPTRARLMFPEATGPSTLNILQLTR